LLASDTRPGDKLIAEFCRHTPQSGAWARRAQRVLPDGISTDTRYFEPYGIYVAHGAGPRKWDVDGNEYLDFFGGHGALMLGHCHPAVTAAVQAAVSEGIQFAANHSAEVVWAEAVTRCVPSAEKVRFAGSGTEATLLALRIARAYTGRTRIIRIATHYHGWHDAAAVGYAYGETNPPPGLPREILDDIVVVPPNDLGRLRTALAAHGAEAAALIIEPLGSHFGIVPTSDDFLLAAAEEARRAGLLVIFDEVITGFRVDPGGMQSVLGFTPDLTCLAKVAAGGMPGGLVCGSEEVMSVLCRLDGHGRRNPRKFLHQGTFTGNPVTARAATATIGAIADGGLCDVASNGGAHVRRELSELFRRLNLGWRVYGRYSSFHLLPLANDADVPAGPVEEWPTGFFLTRSVASLKHLRMALNLEGVDIAARGTAFLSAVHGNSEIEGMLAAFERAIKRLRAEALI